MAANEDLTKTLVRIVNLPSLSLSPISQDYSLRAHEAGRWSECRDENCHKNPGQPRKATVCDCRQIIWTLESLRRSVGTFSFTNIQEAIKMNAITSKKTNFQTCPSWARLWVPPDHQCKGALTSGDLP